jgi:hypothetical protein
VLVAFYAAPTGQKMLKEMPAMMSESMQAASGIIQKTMAKAMQRVDESRSRKASGRKDRRRQDPQAIACHAELTGEHRDSREPRAEDARFKPRNRQLIQDGAGSELRDRFGLYRRDRFDGKFFLLNRLECKFLYCHESSPEFAYSRRSRLAFFM